MEEIRIRTATPDDAEQLLKIYAPYVEQTAISFEYTVPKIEEFRDRIKNTLKKYAYLVAEVDGQIAGYAYAGAFKGRAAYDWAVETTIYLDETQKKKGIGKKLYQALEEVSKAQNILNLNACIAWPETEEEHSQMSSPAFHEHMGYRLVGKFHRCGYKFDRWYHMIWMEKLVGEHTPQPAPVIPFEELDKEILKKLGIGF